FASRGGPVSLRRVCEPRRTRLASASLRAEADRTTDMFTVYVLKSETAKKSYVGATEDMVRRLKEHNSGKHFYTKRYLPWEVIYTEKFKTWLEARNREVYLKGKSGRKLLKKIFTS
ncbi:MAG: GIY-YIG nuclease family protein, partial [Patescibacteria group bacterium]